MSIRLLGLAGILFTSAVFGSSENIAQLPVPDEADLQIVAQDMLHNGNQVYLAALESEQALAESVRFYQNLWKQPVKEGLPGLVQSRTGHWLLLGRLEGQTHTVIQLDSSLPDRTSGFISRVVLGESSISVARPSFAGLIELSSTSTSDGQALSTLSVYGSHASTQATIKRVAEAMLNQGWSLMRMAEEQGSQLGIFVKAASRAEIVVVLADEYPSLVVVNEVKNQ